MKPTRHIVKPMKGLWTPKRSPWFRKNDDRVGHCTNKKCNLFKEMQGDNDIEDHDKHWSCIDCGKKVKEDKR